jgi:hypothetical protein
MGTSCIVRSNFAILCAYVAGTKETVRIGLELVPALVPPADDPALGFAGEELLADPAAEAVKLAFAAFAAKGVAGVGLGGLELAGAAGVSAVVAD